MANTERGARDAIEQFLTTFTKGSTRNQRRTYMNEYLTFLCSSRPWAQGRPTVDDLLDRSNIEAWLAAARRGATRRRAGPDGRYAEAAANSMAARTTTLTTFARFCGVPMRLPRPRAQRKPRLTAVEAHRAVGLLAAHQPARMRVETWQRAVAVIALAVCTRRGLAELHAMSTRDVELERVLPRVRVAGQWYPLDALSVEVLARWLATRRRLTAGHPACLAHDSLWVTTVGSGPRGSQRQRMPGLPAGRRALQAAQRKVTGQVLGSPLLLEQFCGTGLSDAAVPAGAGGRRASSSLGRQFAQPPRHLCEPRTERAPGERNAPSRTPGGPPPARVRGTPGPRRLTGTRQPVPGGPVSGARSSAPTASWKGATRTPHP